jgi:hypothetical protein
MHYAVVLSIAMVSQTPPTVEEVFAAWQARQDAIQTFHIEWTERATHIRGSEASGRLIRQELKPDEEIPVVPAEDTTVEVQWAVSVNGSRMLTTRKGPSWDIAIDGFSPRDDATYFDGQSETRLALESPDAEFPRATIQPLELNKRLRLPMSISPLLAVMRPFDPALGRFADREGWAIRPTPAKWADRDCWILEKSLSKFAWELSEGQWRENYWLDAERGFLPLHYEQVHNDNLHAEMDWEYEPDPSTGWRPMAWKSTAYGGDPSELMHVFAASVTGSRWHEPLPPERQGLEIPAGTVVQEPGHKLWIALANGERRPITDEERRRGATYEDLLAAPVGMAGLDKSSIGMMWILPVGIAAAMASGWFWWRKRRAEVVRR